MITRIEVEGYKLLNEFSADLRQITVFSGVNAVGKSALLDCLQCISECMDNPLNTVFGWHGGVASLMNAARKESQKLSWKVSFRKPPQGYWKELPLEDGQDMLYEVTEHGPSSEIASNRIGYDQKGVGTNASACSHTQRRFGRAICFQRYSDYE